MITNYPEFEKRKQDHIELALQSSNQASEMNTLDTIQLRHNALPDLDFEQLTLKTSRLGRAVKAPFLVSSMTAGHQDATKINQHLLQACAEMGWTMGVGSQRRELTDPKAAFEWAPLRKNFPQVPLLSNIGIAQLIEFSVSDIQKLIDSLQAEALIVHCNPLQEVIQPEGTPSFKGCWSALENIVQQLDLAVIVKETGCGFSQETLQRLHDIGVAAVDISGLGGTHWGRIEGHRSPKETLLNQAAHTYRNWGIDTVQSIRYAAHLNPCYEIWGSGGVRHGLDAARLFALGVTMVGYAKPMLEAALDSVEKVIERMQLIEYELKIAMFCTGSKTIADLRGKDVNE